jgi:hypothetical protein
MNVYPINALDTAIIASHQKEAYDSMSQIHNRYIEHQVEFGSPQIEIHGKWEQGISADSFIIANTNAEKGTLQLISGGTVLFEKDFLIYGYVNIFDIIDTPEKFLVHSLVPSIEAQSSNRIVLNAAERKKIVLGRKNQKYIDGFVVHLEGQENIRLGYLFIGTALHLPRFLTMPAKNIQLRSEGARTFGGQTIGIPQDTLQSFAVNYARINNAERKLFDAYINSVQTVVPHIIDPYPQAHKEFEPFFATVAEYGDMEKREETGFFWDLNIAWQEAK